MRIEIEIPKEFEEHFKQDKFKDSFERIMADIKHSLENGDCLCAGRYEFETIEMLEKAFKNSRQAYPVDKVVKELERFAKLAEDRWTNGTSKYGYQERKCWLKAIEIVKQGGVTKNCNNCANYTEPDEVDNGCYLCCKGYENNYEPKVDNGGVSDDVCEWEYDKHFEFAKSKCGSIDTHRIEFEKLKFCPYCGKKIRIVSD